MKPVTSKTKSKEETESKNDTSQITTVETEKKLLETIEHLLQKGLVVDAANNAGETHLHLACGCLRLDVCRLLLNNGAEPRVLDKNGNGCLHYMGKSENDSKDVVSAVSEKEMVWYLLSRGCGVNDKNTYGRTALHSAAQRDKVLIVEALLSSGAEVSCVDSVVGATPLHLAAASRSSQVAEFLVMVGILKFVKMSGKIVYLRQAVVVESILKNYCINIKIIQIFRTAQI